jgi:plastocyanin
MVLGQYGGYGAPQSSSTPTVTSAASGSTQTVTVGENGAIAYNPDTIVAAPGTSIEFHFFSPVHSVAQSSFSNPCEPINNTAFFSGPMTVTSGEGVGGKAVPGRRKEC